MTIQTQVERAGGRIQRVVPGSLLIAIAAFMWGLDGLLRRPLSKTLHAGTLVFTEHLILTICVLPLIPAAFRSAKKNLDWKGWASVIFVGAGASAVATILFTQAFAKSFVLNDGGITPLLLQKFQPFIAVAGAAILLREKLHPRFGLFFAAAIAAGYVLTFGFTTNVHVRDLEVSSLSLGAAALWGLGTVFGRHLSLKLKFEEVATLRFVVGFITCSFILPITHSPTFAPAKDYVPLLGVALISGGLFALMLYYLGMQKTPASIATLAELTFPATAAVVGVLFLNAKLTGAQWFGAGALVVVVTSLGILSSRKLDAVGVDVTDEINLAAMEKSQKSEVLSST